MLLRAYCRVVARYTNQEVAGHHFVGFGAHHSQYPCSYLTAAAALGITKEDVNSFIRRLDKVFSKKRGRLSEKLEQPLKQEASSDPEEVEAVHPGSECCTSTKDGLIAAADELAGGDEGLSPPPIVFDDSQTLQSASSANPLNESGDRNTNSSVS